MRRALPPPDEALAACAAAGWDTRPRPESWRSEPGCFAWAGLRNPHGVVLYIDGVEVGVVAWREVDGAREIGMVVLRRFHPVLSPAECRALLATVARPATDGQVLAACAAAGWDTRLRADPRRETTGCFASPSPTGGTAIDLYIDGALVGHAFPSGSTGAWMWSKYTPQRSVGSPEACRRAVNAHPDGDPAFVRTASRSRTLLRWSTHLPGAAGRYVSCFLLRELHVGVSRLDVDAALHRAFPGRWEGRLVRLLPAHWGLALAVARGLTPERRA